MKDLLIILFLLPLFLTAQDKPAYQIFNSKGKEVRYSEMVEELSKEDIVFFGEIHNNPISHWLQLELTKDLLKKRELILGAEMIEADNQEPLNQYLLGNIDQKGLDTLARLWSNYKTDYAPLVEVAKKNNLPFIATNIPRRYATMVYKKGFESLDSLSVREKDWIAPLPIVYDPELPGYKDMLNMMAGHGGENLPKAQAIKDATMAYFILENYTVQKLFLHFNGAYHSQNYEGIVWYLKNQRPDLNYSTITTVLQESTGSLQSQNKGQADFIIVVDEDMTTTY